MLLLVPRKLYLELYFLINVERMVMLGSLPGFSTNLTQSAFGGISSADCVLCILGTSLKSVSAYDRVEINTSLFTVYNFIAWRFCMEFTILY